MVASHRFFRWNFSVFIVSAFSDISISGFVGYFRLSVVVEVTVSELSMVDSVRFAVGNKMPCYRRENRAMPLLISVRIEVYSGFARFLCHSTAFLCRPRSATVQMLKLHKVR